MSEGSTAFSQLSMPSERHTRTPPSSAQIKIDPPQRLISISASISPMAIPVILCFPLFVLHLSVVSSFSPIDHYLIDCGSSRTTSVDLDNRIFSGDSSGSSSRFTAPARSVSLCDSNLSPNSSPIYHTARAFTRPSRYVFEIRDKGHHLVRLHFHRFNSNDFDSSNVQFHVSANDHVLLHNYTAENTRNPKIKDYIIWIDSETLLITFVPASRSKIAFVSAIEVISAPKDLISNVAQFVNADQNHQIHGLTKNALETVYRVNIGGPKVTPFNDSLWRTWIPDDEFFKSGHGSSRIHFSGLIKYQMGGASREICPDNVHNTARIITSKDSIPNSNITFTFPLESGYRYLVRIHLCDIASISLGMIYFNVYLNGFLAYENLDLSSLTNGMLASPFYADFVVDMNDSKALNISLGPSKMSLNHAIDAILNGVEIMKMNNSMGSLDGKVCAQSGLRSWPRRGILVNLVSLIGAMCLLAIAFVVIRRGRRAGVRDSVVWSRLPTDGSDVGFK